MANQKLAELLKGRMTEDEISFIPSAYDTVGDILIFSEFPDEIKKHEKAVSEAIFKFKPNIKVILKKTKKYSGKFRLPKFKVIGGEKRQETIFRENGCIFRIDLGKCYFSPRLSEERKRVFSLVNPDEKVLVMFSGIGISPITISKNSQAKEVYGVELNPAAHKFAEINAKLNKCKNVKLFCGDVNVVVPKLKKKFNRILMPLPKDADSFLDVALKAVKKKGIIHFYDFEEEGKFEKVVEKIEKICSKEKKKISVLNVQKCGQYAPRIFRVCVDFGVLN